MTTTEVQTRSVVKDKSMDSILEEVNEMVAKVFVDVKSLTEVQHGAILTTYIELYEGQGCPIHHYENVIESIKTKIPLIGDGKSLEVIIKKTMEMYLKQKYAAIRQKLHLFQTLTPEQLREYREKNLQNN
jgi:hypothetical protein